jgi:beta-galactosidase GanA
MQSASFRNVPAEASLVRQHAHTDQFITHNFDLDWRGYSFGIQPEVNHLAAARALDVAGMDIYHPTQNHLTGAEIAFGGDLAGALHEGQNYFMLESAVPMRTSYSSSAGKNLLSREKVQPDSTIASPPWEVAVIEEGV